MELVVGWMFVTKKDLGLPLTNQKRNFFKIPCADDSNEPPSSTSLK